MTREVWLKGQDRRRRLLSWGAAAAAYLLAFGTLALVEALKVETYTDFSGPVMVRLGSPEGQSERGVVEPMVPLQPEPSPPSVPESVAPAAAPRPIAPASPPPPKQTAPKQQPAAAAAPSTASAAASAASSAASSSSAAATAQPAPPTPEVARGSEAGNDYETSFGGEAGKIRRSLYVPIYRFLPPPLYLDPWVLESAKAGPNARSPMTTEERRRIIERFYAKPGNVLSLKAPVPLAEREALWLVLEDAGYDPARADYKIGKTLKPVVLSFTVAPAATKEAMPSLAEVEVLESSGYADLDEAVLYGFRKAVFSSDAARPVTGRFIYRF